MVIYRGLVAVVMAAGVLATGAAAALFWLMLTGPVAAAALVGAGF